MLQLRVDPQARARYPRLKRVPRGTSSLSSDDLARMHAREQDARERDQLSDLRALLGAYQRWIGETTVARRALKTADAYRQHVQWHLPRLGLDDQGWLVVQLLTESQRRLLAAHCHTLGLDPGATFCRLRRDFEHVIEEVLARRKDLARTHHPDRGGTNDRMVEINRACADLVASLRALSTAGD